MAKRSSSPSKSTEADVALGGIDPSECELDQTNISKGNNVDRVFPAIGWSKAQTPEVTAIIEHVVAEACVVVNLRRDEVVRTSEEPLALDKHGRNSQTVFDAVIDIMRDTLARGLVNEVARGIQAMSLSNENPMLAALLREALEIACCTPRTDLDVRSELLGCGLAAVSNGLYLDASLRNDLPKAVGSDAVQGNHHAYIFVIPVQVQDLSEDQDRSYDSLVFDPQYMQEFAGLIARGMSEELNSPILGSYIVPRLISHEELSQVSMQSLHDMPDALLRCARNRPEKLGAGLVMFAGEGDEGHDPMSDVPLLGSSRVFYFIGVSWSDDPAQINEIFDIWKQGIPESCNQMLTEVLQGGCDSELHQFNVVGADVFFYGLRAGVQYQRGTVFLDGLEDLLVRMDTEASDCFFEIVKGSIHGVPICPVLRVYGPWLDEIGEVSWPLLTFESMDEQFDSLCHVAQSCGMRLMSNHIMIKQPGMAA